MSHPSIETDSPDDEALEYHPLDPWSVIALVIGLASPVALINPLLTLVPALGLLAAGVSLARLASDPSRPGRSVALVGLALSTIFLSVPVSHYVSTRWLLARQARPAADQFLDFLRQGMPEKAQLLMLPPPVRPPADDGLWSFYRNDGEAARQLHDLVERPPVRMLLALGDKADVRYFKTNGVASLDSISAVDFWYTITFPDEAGHKKTLLVGVLLERREPNTTELNPWRVRDITTKISPDRRPE